MFLLCETVTIRGGAVLRDGVGGGGWLLTFRTAVPSCCGKPGRAKITQSGRDGNVPEGFFMARKSADTALNES